jgi:hypothetical protein
MKPITVKARSTELTVFACQNSAIVGSNPTGGTYVCLFILCLCCSVCRLVTG